MSNWYREYVCSGARRSVARDGSPAMKIVAASDSVSRGVIQMLFRLKDACRGTDLIRRELNQINTSVRDGRKE